METIDAALTKELEAFSKLHGNTPYRKVDFGASGLLKQVKQLARARADAEKELANMPAPRADEIRARIHEAIAADLPGMLNEERGRLEAALEEERGRLERHNKIHRLDLEEESVRAERRFRGMTSGELKDEALAVIAGEKRYNPAVLDSLSAELRAFDPQVHAQLRETIKKERLYDSHRFTPEGEKIVKQLSVLDACAASYFTIPTIDNLGNIVQESLESVLQEGARE